MNYRYKRTQENGDATSNYDIVGEFPVKFYDFFMWVLLNEKSFRVRFSSSNKCYGGWLGNKIEVHERKGRWFLESAEPENWFYEIKDKNITKCWANGGWGQMSYIVTFEENNNDCLGCEP